MWRQFTTRASVWNESESCFVFKCASSDAVTFTKRIKSLIGLSVRKRISERIRKNTPLAIWLVQFLRVSFAHFARQNELKIHKDFILFLEFCFLQDRHLSSKKITFFTSFCHIIGDFFFAKHTLPHNHKNIQGSHTSKIWTTVCAKEGFAQSATALILCCNPKM